MITKRTFAKVLFILNDQKLGQFLCSLSRHFGRPAATLQVPPLIERPLEVQSLIQRQLHASHLLLDNHALSCLLQHQWPGNFYELKVALHLLKLCHEWLGCERIDLASVQSILDEPGVFFSKLWLGRTRLSLQVDMNQDLLPLQLYLDLHEAAYIQHCLEIHNGHRLSVAKSLQVPPSTLVSKAKRLNRVLADVLDFEI